LASLKRKAATSALWSIFGFGGAQLIRLLNNLILTRIFAADIFGLMQLVNVFQQGLFLFSDIGIRPSIVQNERGDDPPFVNTAWTISVGRGAVLWIVALICAGPFSRFYDDPRFADLIPVTAIGLLIMGFNSTKLFSQHRHLKMGRVTMIDLVSQIVTLGVTLTYAFIDPTIWAIVAGGLAGVALKMVLTHVALVGERNRFFWEKAAASALFSFGRWIFFSTLLTVLAGQADRLVFGKLVDLALLGVYGIGLQIAQLPSVALQNLANTVTFPLYSRVHADGEDIQPVYRNARWIIMMLGGWSVAGLCSGGPTIIHLLYESPFYEAGWIVQVLAVGGWFAVIESTNSAAILAKGHALWNAMSSVGKLVGMAIFIPLGFSQAGFVGAVMGYAASDMVKYLVSAVFARVVGLRPFRQDLVATAMIAGSTAAGLLAIRALSLESIHPVLEAFASAVHHAIPLVKPDRAFAVVESIVDFAVVSLVWAPLGVPKLRRLIAQRRSAAEPVTP
jgi:O-antigen/teichoic acid export membrane protein